jgi:cation diffusion facilitator CzcD-associated flavoprotein CzcO
VATRAQVEQVRIDPNAIVSAWFACFSQALSLGDYVGLSALLHDDCYWRDLLTFGWKLQTQKGIPHITSWLKKSFEMDPAVNLRLVGEVSESSLGDIFDHTIESFFDFETSVARGRGHFRLVVDPNAPAGARAVTILTSMRELRAFPEPIKQNRPRIVSMFPDENPAPVEGSPANLDVLIIGAGQSGLMLAARLRQVGVRALIVDKSEHVGDVWRTRYRSLKLHNETSMNHFPYLSFPESWPVYLPRDKVVSWLEFYAKSMDLDIATSTTFVRGTFDHEKGCWSSLLRHSDGREYTLNPKHIVLAAGVSGAPKMPKVPGADKFNGTILHSSDVNDSFDVKGKRIVVVGAGTSAHDIAHMSYMNGADVTLVQRSSVTVASLEPSSAMAYATYRNNDGVRNIDDVDLIYASVPYDLLRRLQVGFSRKMMKLDEKLIAGLRKVGFLWDNGEDDTGFIMKVFRYQGGYYINVGASDLIIEGKIKLKAGVEVSSFDGSFVNFSDGTNCKADIAVFATGYRPLEHTVARLFGDEVASRVGPIWGIGEDGEIRATYARTGHPNFYVTGGGIAGARSYSRYTALLIKAQLEGLVSSEPAADATPELRHSKRAAYQRAASDAH